MAVLRHSPPLLLLLIFTSLILRSSQVHSFNCASKKFSNQKTYLNCTNLPTLNSTLHWTFTAQNSSLSVAFIAPPATPTGWIAWAINPTQTGMAGSQSFIAFKDSNGSMTLKTYNISSYSSIVEGKISFDVLESSAEFTGGVMVIFATVKLPETMTAELNHVWQVGSAVKNGMPGKHEFLPENLKAVGKLQLEGKAMTTSNGTTAGSPSVAPSSNGSTAGSPTVAPSTSSSSSNAYGFLLLIGCLLFF